MPIKPWSIPPTVQDLDRLRGLLGVLAQMEGIKWNRSSQVEFQIRLIQKRVYGHGSCGMRFYEHMPRAEATALQSTEEIPRTVAEQMFTNAGFKNTSLRGQRLLSPLQWCGFADTCNGHVTVTNLGQSLLAEELNYKDIVLHILERWQIPNPLDRAKYPHRCGYQIKPFGSFLQIILDINRLCEESGMESKGISLNECEIFVLTMVDGHNTESIAKEMLSFRRRLQKVSPLNREKFIEQAFRVLRPEFVCNQMETKAYSTLRFFRMTGMIQFESDENEEYINTSPFYESEVRALANASTDIIDFYSADEYKTFLSAFKPPTHAHYN